MIIEDRDPRTASISGIARDETGKPLPRATIHFHEVSKLRRAHRFAPLRPVGLSINGTAVTGADGTFRINALPEGNYVLCASGTLPEHLLSCQWGQQSTHLFVRRGQALAGVGMSIRTGVLLTFTIADALRRLEGVPDIGLGITDPGVWYARAKLVSRTPNSSVYRIAVPKSRELRIYLGTKVALADTSGNVVEPGRLSLSIPTGTEREKTVALVTR